MKVLVDLTQDEVSATNLADLKEDEKVTITLDKEKCEKNYLRFNDTGDLVRETPEAVEKYAKKGFPYELCVQGSKTLKSSRGYWVVELKQTNVQTKKSWLIGVARLPCTIGANKSDFTQSEGFWFLYSDPEKGVRVNSEPEVTLVVKTPPERIGVLLDFDKGQLAFYNLTNGVCLLTMLNNVKGELVPLFNPGIGDESPLKIINPQVQTQNQPKESGGVQASNANQH
ncbi:E3 ubiquitin-protein ligase TRIM11-like [Clarias gariepinus]|uniref:E3 ubiquitin-protein ligase TRIM11-like n=1 Tax=Clarias gariepinus TaxID=13013 RepID=UPI00234CB0B2|nr:E3 ubiquitin-protein ligase TRIM11-like [Clarias gariepinus]